ncbi:hypothetical protein FRC06_000784 [Ceratobasidium sp. 370]|nr:hypothetical protein FRC06_000784 [Ceratobasidium sp. 370]
MSRVPPSINIVADKLVTAGVNKDPLLATADGTKLAPKALTEHLKTVTMTVSGIVTPFKNLKSLGLVQTRLVSTKELATVMQTSFGTMFPQTADSFS